MPATSSTTRHPRTSALLAAALALALTGGAGCARHSASPEELRLRQQEARRHYGLEDPDARPKPPAMSPYEYHVAMLSTDNYIGTMEVGRPDPLEKAYRELARTEDPELRLAILDRIVELDRNRQPFRHHIVEDVHTTVYNPPAPLPMIAEIKMADE
jgi:hypothetical protein